MRALLIFDHLNDALFTKCDPKFAAHVHKLAKQQGLLDENKDENDASNFKPTPNIIMQLFSPIITSQNIMASQFGNTYTSIKCHDGTNVAFEEYMGHTFVFVADQDVDLMQKTLCVSINIVKHICGPDVSILKTSKKRSQMVSYLLDAWNELRRSEQSILTEAVEQLAVSPDLATQTLKVLSNASDKLRAQSEFANVHVLVLVQHKFLSLFSSKNAQDLLASDILFMVLLCHLANTKKDQKNDEFGKDNAEDFILMSQGYQTNKNEEEIGLNKGNSKKLSIPTFADITKLFEGSRESSVSDNLCSYAFDDGLWSQIVILGSDECGYTANAVHISELAEGMNLVSIIEIINVSISSGLYDSFQHLNILNRLQMQKDVDELRPAFENLESSIKKILDGIKRNRSYINSDVELCQRRLQIKWDLVKRKYVELLKSRDVDSIMQVESNTGGFVDGLKELFRLTCLDDSFLKLGSTLTINKYLEEFPGLVHFIYIDRTTHRLTAPSIDFTNSETLALTLKKIWTMVEQSRMHLQEGHLSVMWKDTTFNYAYFLWFEDNSGSPLKCKTHFSHTIKDFPVPGIFSGDYYRKLAEAYFPKTPANKIRIYELYCVHLGLATSSCVLEHSRRLAATIWEVTGLPNNPADIL
ncbi:hypothetical protein QAD02_022735 [Eretmocerus hayati]|uniref:Uncharacterized protein n=1 Tax=Eretmocerus hayati TaxID=131215 RepID=A0ACC2PVH3_9HYME|nr:hypothetical protein QAD02_022735 [Eretmocerus hayati]